MDLSLFLMKVSQFNADDPEVFARYLSEKVMHRLENKIQKVQELRDFEQQLTDGEFDEMLDQESLFMKSKRGGE